MDKLNFLVPENLSFGAAEIENLRNGLRRFRFVQSPVIYDKDTRVLVILYYKTGNESSDAISDFVNGFFCALNK